MVDRRTLVGAYRMLRHRGRTSAHSGGFSSRRVAYRPAFTLIELLVVVATIALLIGLLLPTIGRARRSGLEVKCVSQMAQLMTASTAYSIDYDGKMHGYSWTVDEYTPVDGFGAPADNLEAAVLQMNDLIRRRSSNTDFRRELDGLIPHVRHSQLVLVDYLDGILPNPVTACPFDTPLLEAQADPDGYNGSLSGEFFIDEGWDRYAYTSTYHLTIAALDPAQSQGVKTNTPDVVGRRWIQSPHNVHVMLGGALEGENFFLGAPRFSDVRYPSRKVMKYHEVTRHSGRDEYFFAEGNIAQPMSFFDNSVRTYGNDEMNPGWNPERASLPVFTKMNHRDRLHGRVPSTRPGFIKWTRGGLLGIDVGGDEIDTGLWFGGS